MITRYIVGVGLGAAATFGLFYLMQWLITSDKNPLEDGVRGKSVELVEVREEEELQTRNRKPEPPPPPWQRSQPWGSS